MHVKTLTRLAVIAGLSITPAVAAAQDREPVAAVANGVRKVTLEEVVQLAILANPTVISAQGTLRGTSAARRQAWGNWLPSITAGSNANKASSQRVNQATGELLPASWSYGANINASMVLFDNGFQRIFQNKQANANMDRDEAALVDAKFTVTLNAKTAFFDAVAAGELERVRETQIQAAENQLKISREKLAAGSAIRSDTLRATVTLGNAKVALLQARANQAATEAALARVIGLDGAVRPSYDLEGVTVVPLDTAALRSEAMQGAPSIARASAARRAAEASVTVQKQNYLPRVSASYSQTRSGADIANMTKGWSLGVNLQWTLFNGFGRETQLVNALSSRETAIAQEADSRRQVDVLVTQQVANLAAAEAQLSISLASRGAAEEDLRISRERYRLGAATLVDVLQAQANFDQTQVDAVTARKSYQVAKANLSALVGREL